MARIAGIDLPKDKRIEIGLTYIYGIGRKSAKDILEQTGVDPDIRVKDLTDADEQVFHADVGVHASLRQDVLGALSANAVDIGEADLNTLILRQVNTGNTCHTLKAPPI